MFEFYEKALYNLDQELTSITLDSDDKFEANENAINTCKMMINNIRTHFKTNQPNSIQEEICFFKNIKPRFISRLIYHLKIYNIETKRPNGSIKIKRKYFQLELKKLKNFFDENLDFYRYFRTGSTYLDHKYFVRGKNDIRLNSDPMVHELDATFSTSHDYKISSILANDRLQVYLEKELMKLDFGSTPRNPTHNSAKSLKWTTSKVALIELLYALYASRVINNGRADIKTIAAHFEKTFDIELGDYYRTYLELRQRNNPTKFLDAIKDNLLNKIEEDDEK